MTQLTITRPDDWHVHLRDGDALPYTVPDAARYFGRAIIMPNLAPPIISTAQAQAYGERIMEHRPDGSHWQPLMVLYLTDNTLPEEITRAKASGNIFACKYYPAGATTNSDSGVTNLNNIYPVLAQMEKVGLPLLLHGESTDSAIDVFDREAAFIERHLDKLVSSFPSLKVVLEHISTREGVQFVAAASANVAATITPQHLLYNRNQMLAGGIKPHYYCLPILKCKTHQEALITAATSANPKYFLGTDSAPHATNKKENACGCAGCYSNHAAIELYAEAFEKADALDKLEGFASFFGADFYGLPRNTDHITLKKEAWKSPTTLPFGNHTLTPLGAGETRLWQVA
ncbi:MAG: dihydroorotase [Porticoccus sp.]|jgi:dihydroorotase